MSGFQAIVIEDSVSEQGARLTTLQLRYPRFIHAEFMTHRVFSRNASSSRAIPVAKMIEQVRNEPAMPVHWGKNMPGMQAKEELDGLPLALVKDAWFAAAQNAANAAEFLMNRGAHKQIANRLLESFQWISVVVTATEWANFFELRDHPDAQPEIQHLAKLMRAAMDGSKPALRKRDRLNAFAWHLPYVSLEERIAFMEKPPLLAKASAARSARVSYLKHDGTNPSIEDDLKLYERLVGSRPLHASPVEHQGYPLPLANQWDKNFKGWRQHRSLVEQEIF
jgi:thymidylate synthase ThyX